MATRSSEWRIGHWVNDLGLLRLQSSVRDFHHASRPRSSLEKKRLQHKTAFVVGTYFGTPFFRIWKGGVAASQNKMARTKEAVRRAQRLGPDRAAAEERCRRRRAAIAKAARVMSVEEVEIATIEREVVHCPARAPS